MNKLLFASLVVVTLISSACAAFAGSTVKVEKEIIFTQGLGDKSNYLYFKHTELEDGMVWVLSYDARFYQLDRDVINLETKDGKTSGQISVPMLAGKVSGVTLSYRKVDCTKPFVFGVKSSESIEFDCDFPK